MHRIIPLTLLFGLVTAPVVPAQEIDTLALRAHTRFLADDLLRGRDTGTPGERLAALYIVSQLQRLGIAGAGPGGEYLLPVPIRAAEVNHDATQVVVRGAGEAQQFRSGRDFLVRHGSGRAFRDFRGEAVFLGTADRATEALGSDQRLDGKVVVLLGPLGRAAGSLVPEWVERGAEGVVLLIPQARVFGRYLLGRDAPRYFVDADVDNPVWQPELPVLVGGPRLARSLLADRRDALAALEEDAPFRAVSLGRTVDATVSVQVRALATANVGGILPGSDPALRDEVVVYTAHYDHLGVSFPDEEGDSIYNGFSDNAAGVSMLLAIAQELREDPPARSVLFLFFTGEERGLLGSSYYVTDPAVPLERTVAVINLDAGAPPAPPATWRVAGGRTSSLGETARQVARARGWSAEASGASPNSDYWPFLQRQVPAVFLIPGQKWEGVSGAAKEALHERWDHYHQPADEWHPDFPFRGLRRYATLALALGRRVADAPDPPRWNGTGTPAR